MQGDTREPGGSFKDIVLDWKKIKKRRAAAGKSTAELDAWGLEWLKRALNCAIRLEFSTIPPYLCAIWSIKDEQDAVAQSIRRIVQQEMLHMALACNMLVAIGGTPKINSCDFVPKYPGCLPGGVHKGLVVSLCGLTPEALTGFMTIELPGEAPTNVTDELRKYFDNKESAKEGQRTIGEFYECVRDAFHSLEPRLSTDRQITGPLAWIVMRDLHDVDQAIELIEHQGEGSSKGPQDTGLEDLAHFYRFVEISALKKIEWDGSKWGFGTKIEPPSVFPMQPAPVTGYPDTWLTEEVAELMSRFDQNYCRLLDHLTDIWGEGGQSSLIAAIEGMFALGADARALMQIKRPDGNGTFGPRFKHHGGRS